MANTSIAKEIKDKCIQLMIEGKSAREVRKIIYDMGYYPPSATIIHRWYGNQEVKRAKLRKENAETYLFKPSDKVKTWLNKQTNKGLAINTVLEWYLLMLRKEERKEKRKERAEQRKNKGEG